MLAMSDAREFHFLLLPEFSVIGFVSAIEPLRVANRFRAGSYRWRILSRDGNPVQASNGMSLNVDASIRDAQDIKTLIVVTSFNPLDYYDRALGEWLRKAAQKGVTLGAIDTGAFILAEARLLGRQPVTLHWEARSAFLERYPSLVVTEELFELGEERMTCAGGTSAIDMMLAVIAREHGQALAEKISEQFVLGRIRSPSDHQRMEVAARYSVHNTNTIQVIKTMEQHLEDPLSPQDLAMVIGVTRRQLERLFRAHLRDTPSHFYLSLRLDRARQLLQQTGMSIMDVCVACGFGSASHFSRAYRARFGTSPKDDRVSVRAPAASRSQVLAMMPGAGAA